MLDYRESEGISEKNIYLCLVNYAKAFVWVMTNWKTLRWESRPSYLSPEELVRESRSKVRTLYGTTDLFKIEKGV